MIKSKQRNREISTGSELDQVAKAVEECEQCNQWKKIRNRARIAELLATAIGKLRERFKENDFKPSIADYLKLVEMEKELADSAEDIKEIKVTWVEPKEYGTGK
jgi:hypothetical protein